MIKDKIIKNHGSAVPHWKRQRLSAIVTLLLMIYSVYLVGNLATLEYHEAVAFVGSPSVALPLAILIGVGSYHAALGVQVIIEDYISLARGRNGLIISAKLMLGGIALASLIALAIVSF